MRQTEWKALKRRYRSLFDELRGQAVPGTAAAAKGAAVTKGAAAGRRDGTVESVGAAGVASAGGVAGGVAGCFRVMAEVLNIPTGMTRGGLRVSECVSE